MDVRAIAPERVYTIEVSDPEKKGFPQWWFPPWCQIHYPRVLACNGWPLTQASGSPSVISWRAADYMRIMQWTKHFSPRICLCMWWSWSSKKKLPLMKRTAEKWALLKKLHFLQKNALSCKKMWLLRGTLQETTRNCGFRAQKARTVAYFHKKWGEGCTFSSSCYHSTEKYDPINYFNCFWGASGQASQNH